jgi:hypothetical protein
MKTPRAEGGLPTGPFEPLLPALVTLGREGVEDHFVCIGGEETGPSPHP